MSRAHMLAQRRAMLMAECALQRATLEAQFHAIGVATGWINVNNSLADRFKNLPDWLSALLSGLIVLVPGRTVSLLRNGLMIWQIWRNMKAGSNKP